MRISGGVARGIPLQVPKGAAVRPATDSLRQAVFSSLGARVVGARFADLFAGSGAYGLEAWSRGAAGGVFVEKHAKAAACLRRNLAAVGKSLGRDVGEVALVLGDALSWQPATPAETPELVFIDPPYELITEVAPRLWAHLQDVLAPVADPVIAFETPGSIALDPPGWTVVKRLGKGAHQPSVSLFRRA